MSLLQLAVLEPVTVNGPLDWAGVVLSLIFLIAACAIFFGGLHLIKSLWVIVFDAFNQSDETKAKLLRDLVGGLSIGGKFKIVGVGLCGTLLILFFCIKAIALLDIRFNSNAPAPVSSATTTSSVKVKPPTPVKPRPAIKPKPTPNSKSPH